MKRKEDNDNAFFGGFEAVVDGLARIERVKPGQGNDPEDGFETVTEIGNSIDEIPMTDPAEITGDPNVELIDDDDNGQEDEEQGQEEEVLTDDVTDIVADKTKPAKDTPAGATSDLGEYEKDVVDFFTERFTEELGWDMNDETKPKTVGEVVEYLKGVVEASSTPQFANEDIEKLNDFVANGGDLRQYYKEAFGSVDLDLVDISNENIQKKILTDNLTRQGYSPERINKYIDRYEDSGTLQEEAEDALESLKEYRQEKSEKLLAEQENQRKAQLKEQQNFLTNVYTTIDKTDSILGIPISVKEKKELRDYIFKPEADGLTKYQKDYAKDNKNLIESAYITMKGNTLIQKVTQKATSQAAKNLQDKLANKGKRVKNSSVTHGSSSDSLGAWSTVSRQLRRPNF